MCENTDGSFFCACDGDEKALSSDGKSCVGTCSFDKSLSMLRSYSQNMSLYDMNMHVYVCVCVYIYVCAMYRAFRRLSPFSYVNSSTNFNLTYLRSRPKSFNSTSFFCGNFLTFIYVTL